MAVAMTTTSTYINLLPIEILEAIFKLFCTETLDKSISKVCSRFKALTETIIQNRLRSQNILQFPETWNELKSRFPGNDTDDLTLLKEFERVYMGSSFNIQIEKLQGELVFENPILMARFREAREFMPQRSARVVPVGIDSCPYTFRQFLMAVNGEYLFSDSSTSLSKSFKHIPCYHLMLILVNGKVNFFHESVFTGPRPYSQYNVTGVKIPKGVDKLDIYQDKLGVVLKDKPGQVQLYQIVQVWHEKWELTLLYLEAIDFPGIISEISLFKNKVYVLSNTYRLHMWQGKNGIRELRRRGVVTCKQKLVDDPNQHELWTLLDVIGPMFKLNSLLIFRIKNVQRQPMLVLKNLSTAWYVLNMNDSSVKVWKIQMEAILKRLAPSPLQKPELLSLRLSGNVLLVHFHGQVDKGDTVLSMRLNRDPEKEDFLDLTKLCQLVDMSSISSSTLNIYRGFISPIPASWFGSTQPAFLGLDHAVRERNEGIVNVATLVLSNSGDDPNSGIYIG